MTVEEAVIDRLVTTAGVTALVGTRVYQFVLPQKPTLPAIRVQLVSDPRSYHLRGVNGLERSRVQVDAYAAVTSGSDPYASAEAVADAIDTALSGVAFETSDSPSSRAVTASFRITRMPIYESEELRQVRMLQDFDVWSRPM